MVKMDFFVHIKIIKALSLVINQGMELCRYIIESYSKRYTKVNFPIDNIPEPGLEVIPEIILQELIFLIQFLSSRAKDVRSS